MTEEFVPKAVQAQVQRIAIAQQNLRAWQTILYRNEETATGVRGGGISKEARAEVSSFLYRKLSEAWDGLSWLAPISEEATRLLAERTRSWFERDDTEVMSFLGEYGSTYVADKQKFLTEVRSMFTGAHDKPEE